jgi:hypothetical protein
MTMTRVGAGESWGVYEGITFMIYGKNAINMPSQKQTNKQINLHFEKQQQTLGKNSRFVV